MFKFVFFSPNVSPLTFYNVCCACVYGVCLSILSIVNIHHSFGSICERLRGKYWLEKIITYRKWFEIGNFWVFYGDHFCLLTIPIYYIIILCFMLCIHFFYFCFFTCMITIAQDGYACVCKYTHIISHRHHCWCVRIKFGLTSFFFLLIFIIFFFSWLLISFVNLDANEVKLCVWRTTKGLEKFNNFLFGLFCFCYSNDGFCNHIIKTRNCESKSEVVKMVDGWWYCCGKNTRHGYA